MSVIRERSRHFQYYDDEPPSKKLVSEGDVLVKQLYEKQQSRTINLAEELHKEKAFEKATDYVPVTSFAAGESSLKKFKLASEYCEELENLKRTGLSNEDIRLYYESKKGDEALLKQHKNWETSSLKHRLQVIDGIVKKLQDEEPKIASTNSFVSRHHKECVLSVKPQSLETKLLKFALESKQQSDVILPHPMDYIKDLEKNLNENLADTAPVNITKIRKKARSLAKKILGSGSEGNCEENVTMTSNSNSKWDLRKPATKQINVQVAEKNKVYTCKPQNFYTICNGEILKLGDINDVKKKEMDDNRPDLLVDEIKKLPKFENYEIGMPANVLYLKNLSCKVDKDRLKLLLQEVDQDYVEIKLMKGKMRGQAFITFTNEERATTALNKINGKFIQGKPIIVQYAKGKANTKKDNG